MVAIWPIHSNLCIISFIKALRTTPFLGGKTNSPEAFRLLRQEMFHNRNGGRDRVKDYAIIITDGNSNIDPENTIPEAVQTRIQGIHIIVVSVGKDMNWLELEGIASEPQDRNIYNVESIRDLYQIHDAIKTSFCDGILASCLSKMNHTVFAGVTKLGVTKPILYFTL